MDNGLCNPLPQKWKMGDSTSQRAHNKIDKLPSQTQNTPSDRCKVAGVHALFSGVARVHFIGIGGIGMSGIAEVLLELGFEVSGSDIVDSSSLDNLRNAGADIFIGHRAINIKGADAVVFSSAVCPTNWRNNPPSLDWHQFTLNQSNCEMQAAVAQKIPLVPRAEMLGELMRFRKGIAIAGTHGKTTTTSLVATVLATAGVDPTFVVGGIVTRLQTNARLGKGEFMVVEADESDASFLHLQPHIAVLTNIDEDHLEAYGGDFAKLQQTYLDFLHNLPFYGLAILCFDDPHVREISEKLRKPFASYGLMDGVDYQATQIRYQGRNSFFTVVRYGQSVGEFVVAMPGAHNVRNALAAIAVGYRLQLSEAAIGEALAGFQGIGRRFEELGVIALAGAEVELVDDYAHHPTELAATIDAAQACWPGRRVLVVFQPHRYSRTSHLFDDFAELLSGLDNLLVTEVYAAGEQPISAADGRSLCRAIRARGKEPVFVESLDNLTDVLSNLVKDGDIILTLGAGDIGRFARNLATSLGIKKPPQRGVGEVPSQTQNRQNDRCKRKMGWQTRASRMQKGEATHRG